MAASLNRHALVFVTAWSLALQAVWSAEHPRFVFDDAEFLQAVTVAGQALAEAGKLVATTNLQCQLNRGFAAMKPAPVSHTRAAPPDLFDRLRESTLALGEFYRCGNCTNWHFDGATAFVVGSDGVVSTSYHVVGSGEQEPAGTPSYFLAADAQGRAYPVLEVLAADAEADTCLLRIDAHGLRPLPLRTNIRTGERVFCLSHPEGSHFLFTAGMVSRVTRTREIMSADRTPIADARSQRRLKMYLNVTSEFSPGSSGGPIVDESGNAVAQAQSLYGESGATTDDGSSTTPLGTPVRFAVAAEEILRLMRPPPDYVAPAPLAEPPGFQPDSATTAAELFAQMQEVFREGTDALEEKDAPLVGAHWFRRFDSLAKAFAERFPDDTNRWEVALLQVRAHEEREQHRVAAQLQDPTALLRALLAASDAAPGQKTEASHRLVALAAERVGKGVRFGAWEKSLQRHLAEHPDDPDAGQLQIEELRLAEAHAPKRLEALAKQLANSPDAGVANAAVAKLEALRARRDLKEKPLELKFTALDGQEFDLARLRGHVVLLHFWAASDDESLNQLPQFAAVFDKLRGKGLAVIGVALNSERLDVQRVVRQKKIGWPQCLETGEFGGLAERYGVETIPTLWLLNKQGRVVDFSATADGLEEKLEKLMAE